MMIPRIRRISDVIEEMHEEDPFCALSRHFVEQIIWNNKITAMKYGNAWLINLDEFYGYFQNKNRKTRIEELPLKKNMKTSGQIYRIFLAADEDTILRKPNMRRFCDAYNIHKVVNNELHKPLYDFNELLLTVNPKGINYTAPMPIIRRFENAVNDMRVNHFEISKRITWKLCYKIIREGKLWRERYGKGWILNYKEFEEEILKALDVKSD